MVTAVTDLNQLFARLLDGALQVTESEAAWLLLADEAHANKLILRATRNVPPLAGLRLNQPRDDGLSHLLTLSGEGITLAGEPLSKMPAGQIVKAAVAVPIKAKEQVMGVLVAGNKCDLDADGTFAAMARQAAGPDLPFLPVSAERGDGLPALRERLFRELRRIRVYTKEPGHKPDLGRPFVLPEGATVHELALQVHKDLAERLKFARIWGPQALFDGQQVDRHHALGDREVVELHA